MHQTIRLTGYIGLLGNGLHTYSFIMFGSRCWIYKHCYTKFKI